MSHSAPGVNETSSHQLLLWPPSSLQTVPHQAEEVGTVDPDIYREGFANSRGIDPTHPRTIAPTTLADWRARTRPYLKNEDYKAMAREVTQKKAEAIERTKMPPRRQRGTEEETKKWARLYNLVGPGAPERPLPKSDALKQWKKRELLRPGYYPGYLDDTLLRLEGDPEAIAAERERRKVVSRQGFKSTLLRERLVAQHQAKISAVRSPENVAASSSAVTLPPDLHDLMIVRGASSYNSPMSPKSQVPTQHEVVDRLGNRPLDEHYFDDLALAKQVWKRQTDFRRYKDLIERRVRESGADMCGRYI